MVDSLYAVLDACDMFRSILCGPLNQFPMQFFLDVVALTHYDGVSGASMSAQPFSMLVCFINARCRLLVREVTILSCMCLCYLI